jgi:carboxyl-terminal processing protease
MRLLHSFIGIYIGLFQDVSGFMARSSSVRPVTALHAEPKHTALTIHLQRALITATVSWTLLFSPNCVTVPNTWAADYGSLTTEQKAVAEAWRIVDNNFIDRTFNHQDWFKVRQDAVKKKYKSMEEANVAIETLVSSLGDKYTRYLPLNKYKSIVDAATGTLAGIGVELSTNPTTHQVCVSDVEANSPASTGMFSMVHGLKTTIKLFLPSIS